VQNILDRCESNEHAEILHEDDAWAGKRWEWEASEKEKKEPL